MNSNANEILIRLKRVILNEPFLDVCSALHEFKKFIFNKSDLWRLKEEKQDKEIKY